ncbi:capsule assembly Wzi family protein [Dysgonomonas sp. 520]|uniref:capsule assembly Wzi family protein n=1 Tax=Dysgonomonas sp. 520 TaxID=2302931 RepID=UPI0013D580B1|nr:capsule assembly Wzi family protein [Dysgonomonas sp. 520]
MKKYIIALLLSIVFCSVSVDARTDNDSSKVVLMPDDPYAFLSMRVERDPEKLEYIEAKIEAAGVFSSGDNTPFWMTNNNYGIGSLDKNNQHLQVGLFANKKVARINNKQLWAKGGVEILAANNFESDFYFHQLYVDLKYRSLGLSIGAKERKSEYLNDMLSTGGMSRSINARPIPQVEAGFPDYVTVPFTNNLLHIKGALSYGWFTDNKFSKKNAQDGNYALDVLYHNKYIFFKFDKNRPFNFTFGLEMAAQFGGKMYRDHKYVGNSPAKLKDFFKILIPSSGDSDSNGTDQINILGNMYGSWHFLGNYKFKNNITLKAYHDHFFDDHSGMWFKNKFDGLWGVELSFNKRQPITNILFEYVNTKSQSGPFLWDESPSIPIQVSAGDDYYNSVDYVSVSNYGQNIGNPLLVSPIYNNGKSLYIYNNRISAFHLGVSGYVSSEVSYRAKYTLSKSWGTYFVPSTDVRKQYSFLLDVNYQPYFLDGWLFGGSLAYDDSDMVGDNFGVRFKVAKSFFIK